MYVTPNLHSFGKDNRLKWMYATLKVVTTVVTTFSFQDTFTFRNDNWPSFFLFKLKRHIRMTCIKISIKY